MRTQNWNLRLLEARGKFGTTNAYQNKSGRIRTGKYYLLCLTGVRGSQFSRDGTNWLYWHGHHVLVCWSKSCHSNLIWHRVYMFSTWYHAVSSWMQRLSTFNWFSTPQGWVPFRSQHDRYARATRGEYSAPPKDGDAHARYIDWLVFVVWSENEPCVRSIIILVSQILSYEPFNSAHPLAS